MSISVLTSIAVQTRVCVCVCVCKTWGFKRRREKESDGEQLLTLRCVGWIICSRSLAEPELTGSKVLKIITPILSVSMCISSRLNLNYLILDVMCT